VVAVIKAESILMCHCCFSQLLLLHMYDIDHMKQDRMAEFGKRTKREARALAQGGKEGTEVVYTLYI
jgi:hypothetical protein